MLGRLSVNAQKLSSFNVSSCCQTQLPLSLLNRTSQSRQSTRTFSTGVRLAIWCDSPEAVSSGVQLLSRFSSHGDRLGENGGSANLQRVKIDETTIVDLVSLPAVSRRRRMLFRKHGGARLVQVSFASTNDDVPSLENVAEGVTKLVLDSNLVYQDSPNFRPHISTKSLFKTTESKRNNAASDQVYVREVIVGAGEHGGRFEEYIAELDEIAESAGPFLYHINGQTFLRIVPSLYSAVVFSVPDLQAERERSEHDKTFLGRIGANGMNEGQFHITSPNPEHLRGLDIRMCGNRGAPSPMFAESNEATYENSLQMTASTGDVSCRGMTGMEGMSRVKRFWSNLGMSQ